MAKKFTGPKAKGHLTWSQPLERWADLIVTNAELNGRRICKEIADEFTPRIEQWMRDNAIWQDQTGDARRTLRAEVEAMAMGAYKTAVKLSHGVPYGKWLEYAHQGRYSIIRPAMQHWAPLVFAAAKSRLEGQARRR